MYKVMKTFICRVCTNPVTGTWYKAHKCRYWCQCKSGVTSLVI